MNFVRVLKGALFCWFWLIGVLREARYDLSQAFWAVRSWPAATGMTLSYLLPNRNSMQNPKRGRSLLAFSTGISMLKSVL